MKKIVLLASLALIGVYLIGRITLGEAGAMRFVMRMEALMGEGKADEVCAMLHDDLDVSITDHSSADGSLDGGKDELCAHTRLVTAALQTLPHSMQVDIEDVRVRRDWLHPWTSTVSYVEKRNLTVRGANVQVRTISEDTITLVQTLSGVRLRKLVAEVTLEQ